MVRNMEIKRLKPEHFYELRNLLDGVFSRAYGRETRFAVLFPRLFAEPNEYCTSSHLGAFEGDRLIGTAAMYPMDYVVGGVHIKLIGNGNVAVHEDVRGRGIMSRLLEKINEECDACGDVGYLHGKIDRYARFGYYSMGIQYQCTVQPGAANDVEFVPMRPGDVTENQRIYTQMPDYIVRNLEDFIPALRSQGRKPLTVFRHGEQIGYISLDCSKAAVEEYALSDRSEALVFRALAGFLGKPVMIRLSGYATDALERLSDSSTVQRSEPAQFRIIHSDPLKSGAAALGLDESVIYAPYLT